MKHWFDHVAITYSYTFDPLPGVDSCGQRTENEERLFLPRIAGSITNLWNNYNLSV